MMLRFLRNIAQFLYTRLRNLLIRVYSLILHSFFISSTKSPSSAHQKRKSPQRKQTQRCRNSVHLLGKDSESCIYYQPQNNIPLKVRIDQWPLTEKEILRLSKTLSKYLTRSQTGESSSTQRLFAPFLGTNHAWLNTDVLNDFMEYLTTQYSTKHYPIACIDPGLLKKAKFAPLYDRVHKRPKWRQRLLNANLIFMPIEFKKHWYLVIIQKEANQDYVVRALDGLHTTAVHPRLCQRAKKLILDFSSDLKEVPNIRIKKSISLPRQHNTDDCGLVCCFAAYQTAKHNVGEPFHRIFKPYADYQSLSCDYSLFRLLVARKLLAFHQSKKQYSTLSQFEQSTQRSPQQTIEAPIAPKRYNPYKISLVK